MNEIKFRIWDTVLKEWWTKGSTFWQIFEDIQEDVLFKEIIWKYITIYNYIKILKDKLVFQQYSGLKDKNGKEIYEGDIIKYKSSNQQNQNNFYEHIDEVYFYNGGFYIGDISLSECYSPDNVLTDRRKRHWGTMGNDYFTIDFDFEIIGNIYENPELLEVKNV